LWPVLGVAENGDGFSDKNIFARPLASLNFYLRIGGRCNNWHTKINEVLQWMQCFKLSNPLQRLGSERVQLGSEAYL